MNGNVNGNSGAAAEVEPLRIERTSISIPVDLRSEAPAVARRMRERLARSFSDYVGRLIQEDLQRAAQQGQQG